MRQLAKSTCLFFANRSRLVRSANAYIHAHVERRSDSPSPSSTDTYPYLKRKFIANGKHSHLDEKTRTDRVLPFEEVDREVPIGTTPTDGFILAELLINCRAPGDVVECGCYAGGWTAKLSIVAKSLRRRLIVFDIFEGLTSPRFQ